ncbi:phosphotransferase [Micromonospora sp. NBC_01796]|uniref:phosphotransferase n=1 Tax=Micromonospora sp. NBC_01796 TaxID=2975987 RepID=UPI002DD807D5|nr:phosphotransferase [Micromonospora sp. NBC_01796]WSA84600.1 aminoglycoside phosphotransferase family protein [Micromonospora sp. NBC_01796]
MGTVLTPPVDLTEDALMATLGDAWGLAATSVAYRPVGWGSHHWEVEDTEGARWFVNVDELETKRHTHDESPEVAFDRLRAALGAARALRDHGTPIVVAPEPTRSGEPLARLSDRFGLALYTYVNGQSFSWGEFSAPDHRRALLDLVVAVHSAPDSIRRRAMADDFAVPHRDALESGLRADGDLDTHGPYAHRTSVLLTENAAPIRHLLARYDELVLACRAQPDRAVLTHGEPHPGNTMLTPDGWRLIDWETTLVAPPERDLWNLDPGDGSILDAYADITGVTPLPELLELYRIRWDLSDLAVDVDRFRRPHTGTADDDQSWELLHRLVTHLGA